MLTRYWFEFEWENIRMLPIGLGCGVTAYNYNDAIFLLSEQIFKNEPIAPFKKVIENVDVSTLDAGHVLPNMLSPNCRGIWFPLG